MEFATIGRIHNKGKIALVYVNLNDDLRHVLNKDSAFLLAFIKQGEGVVRQGGRQERFSGPCFICADERQNVHFQCTAEVAALTVYFNPEFLNINMKFSLLRKPGFEDLADVHSLFLLSPFTDEALVLPVLPPFCAKVEKLYKDMHSQLTQQPDWYWSCRARSYFMELIGCLEQLYDLKRRGQLHTVNGYHFISDYDDVKQALVYISANYPEKIHLDALSKSCGSNRTTLSNNFKAASGMTVLEYIVSFRINAAAEKLRFTELTVKEIAAACGFGSTAHFCRAFKQYMRLSPQQFRRMEIHRRKQAFAP